MNNKEKYHKYLKINKKAADVGAAVSLMHWDKEIYLPEDAAEFRSQQIATLTGIRHEIITSDEFGALVEDLSNSKEDLSDEQQKNVSLTQTDLKKMNKYSKEFVERMSLTVSKVFHAWMKAREASDFGIFQEPLKEMIDLKREETEILGYEDHPYDALMDDYEPGAKTKDIEHLFSDVRNHLVDFVKEIAKRPQVDDSFLKKHFDKDKQWDFGLDLLKQMGYDFKAGRQDLSTHPFTTEFSMKDVRVTTRIDENNFCNMTWSCIHEGGHALYEQGLKPENYGIPAGSSISLGIHESQSRLWENNVGRSLNYWKGNYPKLQNAFGENLNGVDLGAFYKAINKVEPSLIRTESDELTYHFHIMIRFEIEKALIEGSIDVKDIPEVWNAKYKSYLNVEVPNDAKGCLQDIHWSHGSLGYFPTYSIGSFYACQFFDQAKKDIPNLEEQIAQGKMSELLNWLRINIHQHGRLFGADEICKKVTGEELNFKSFVSYAKEKYGTIYGLA